MHIIASSKANALTLNLDINSNNKQPVYTLHFSDIEDIYYPLSYFTLPMIPRLFHKITETPRA